MKLAVERGVVQDKDWDTELTDLLALQTDQALPENLQDAITSYLQTKVSA
jgi:hypothetical protein